MKTTLAVVAAALAARGSAKVNADCYYLPSDPGWPSLSKWNALNATVGGRLIKTVPIGAVCHDPWYDEAACTALRGNWTNAPVHYLSSSSVMTPFWQNRSCDPFEDRSAPCVVGTYVSYAVNVSSPEHIASTVKFAKKNNIRLVVKNTGHDFIGRSTGTGGLSVWTHYLKDTEVLEWSDKHYKGPALKLGAGIQGFEAIAAAGEKGLVVVGGYCPTVGLVGGYTQGAGHSPLGNQFGMAADQTLEFEVVTTSGDIVVASRDKNSDLYWALSGGGPGTYGIVTSLTVRAHQDAPIGGAVVYILDFSKLSNESYWSALTSMYANMPSWVDAGLHATVTYNASIFFLGEVTGYNMTSTQVKAVLEPWTSVMDNLSIPYFASYTDFPTYRQHWQALVPEAEVGTFWQTGGQMVPREVLEQPANLTAYMAALRYLVDSGLYISGTVVTPKSKTGAPNAVLPAWRDNVVLHATLQSWDFNPSNAVWMTMEEEQQEGTHDYDPLLDAIVPRTGVYMNEADSFRPNWKEKFFGENYDRLLAIKDKWDPYGLLYGRELVGSDRWTVAEDGRMCRACD
ncbi:isoamyl alcohol oxidase [Thozetella sp. PMI_491]|nr:isoamyl alcohol oxidase [Thozetella sp. PMI_491]